MAAKRRTAPQGLLIPLLYAAQFGGICTPVGTSTLLLVCYIPERDGQGAFSFRSAGWAPCARWRPPLRRSRQSGFNQ